MGELSPVDRVEAIMGIIAGKWKPAIVYALVMEGPLRFVELRRRIPKVSQRMITQQLRDLERYGIVERVYHPEIPPRVVYSVTPSAAAYTRSSNPCATGEATTSRLWTGRGLDTRGRRGD